MKFVFRSTNRKSLVKKLAQVDMTNSVSGSRNFSVEPIGPVCTTARWEVAALCIPTIAAARARAQATGVVAMLAHYAKSGRFSYEAKNQFSVFRSHYLQMRFYVSPVECGAKQWKLGSHISD